MADPVFVDGVTPLNAVNMNKLQTRDEEGQANGYASLDATGKVPVGQLPAIGAQLTYEGDWAAATTYDDGDVVVKGGIAYLCVGGPTTVAPDPTPWGAAAISAPSYGTTLPASPVDGQEAILVDSLTAPTYQWRFRYNAGSSVGTKWEFVGGTDAYSKVDAAETTTTTGSYVDLTTIGPRITVPRAGDYLVSAAANGAHSAAALIYLALYNMRAAAVHAQIQINPPASGFAGFPPVHALPSCNAGDEIRLRYYVAAAGTATFSGRWLRIQPVRVS